MARKHSSLIIPVFIPHAGCPHQCAFCNQKTISGQADPMWSAEAISNQITSYLTHSSTEKYERVELAFYGGTFLGLPEPILTSALNIARQEIGSNRIHSIRFSTRPETITPESLSLLVGLPVSAIEIGVQSLGDQVLSSINRGHTAGDVSVAAERLKSAGLSFGLQLMVGLPRETDAVIEQTAQTAIQLEPDFVRIYPLTVLRQSPLGVDALKGRYTPPTLETCVKRAAIMYSAFKSNGIPVIRMGLQDAPELSADDVLGGGHHPAFGSLVRAVVMGDLIAERLLSLETDITGKVVSIHCHPTRVSDVVGHKKDNIVSLKARFNMRTIAVKPCQKCDSGDIRISVS